MQHRTPPTAALAFVTGIGAFSTDTYLAALPEVQRSLATTAPLAQLTITAFIVGLAIGMLFGGTISDGMGRRRVLLISATTFLLASIACCFAPDIYTLIACRVVQGVSSGSAASAGRAIVSDQSSGVDAAKRFGTLAAIGLLAPVIAPVVGGLILAIADWRAVFVFLAVLGAVMVIIVVAAIPETLPDRINHSTPRVSLGRRFIAVLRLRPFVLAALVQCFATAGFFSYIGGSSFVLQDGLHVNSGTYAALFATNAIMMAGMSLVFRQLVAKAGSVRLRGIGLTTATLAAATLVIGSIAASGRPNLPSVWICLAIAVGSMGLVQPASTAIGQQIGNTHPGTASSLLSGTAFLIGAAATPLTGLIDASSVTVMATLMLTGFVIASALALTTRLRPAHS